MNPPSNRRKFAFWLLLGMISVMFVEVPAGSTMFPFSTLWGLLVVLPLYLLHSVFLVAVVFRFGRPNFWTLYSAGTLYGMYEAYITKVLWTSFRPEGPFVTVGGIAVFETVILVVFLHPLLAFVVPMFFTEILCTNSSEVAQGLPARAQGFVRQHPARAIGLLMTLLGLMQFVNSPSVLRSFLSGAGNCLVLGLALHCWRRTGGASYSLRELLPGTKGLRNFGILLLAFYGFWGFAIKPKSIPGVWPGQLTIWLIYAGLGWSFCRCLRRSAQVPRLSPETSVAPVPLFPFSWRGFVLACALASGVTTVARMLLFPFVPVQIICMFTFFVVTGIALLAGLLLHIRERV